MELPTGFSETRAGGFVIFTRPVYHKMATSIATQDPETVFARHAAAGGNGGVEKAGGPRPLSGRGRVIEVPGSEGETLILKKNRRGGLYGRFMGDLHATDYEAVSDLFLSETAWKKGVPVALVAFVMAAPAGPGRLAKRWRGYCATIKVEGARSLMDLLSGPPDPHRRRSALSAAGRCIQRAHDRGFFHGDLNLGNILIVESGQGEFGGWLIDLPGSLIGGSLRSAPRQKNLMRLYRSAEKWLPPRDAVQRRGRLRDVVTFLRAYTNDDRAEVRRIMEAAGRYRLSFFFHRLGWMASGRAARNDAV